MNYPCSKIDIPVDWLNGFFREAPVMFYIACGDQERFATLYCSPNVTDILGHEPADFLADPFFRLDRTHPDDVDRVWQRLTKEAAGFAVEDGNTVDCATPHRHLEYRFRHQNGSYRWLRDDYHFVRRLDSSVVVCGWWFDVTEQREDHRTLDATRRKLEEKEQFIQRVLDNIPQQIFWKDRDSVFRGCNLAAARALGLTLPVEIEGKTDHDIIPDRKQAEYLQGLDQGVMTDGEPKYHVNICSNDRERGLSWLDVTKVPIFDDHGKVNGLLISIEDITQRKHLEVNLRVLNQELEKRVRHETEENLRKERMLIQQGRHAAMGEMIGNIGHQWRQPLSTLGLILQNLAWECKEAADTKPSYLTLVEQAVEESMRIITRMSATIDDFRNFFNPAAKEEHFCLRTSIEESIKLLAASFRHHHITCQINLPPVKIKVWGNKNEFSQAILNLLANAKDIIRERKLGEGSIEIQGVVQEQMLTLRVRDNGGGVKSDNLERIFDPYFTTKPGGTGIGLYMTKAIIENRLGGTISCRNTGGGAEFVITLPLKDKRSSPTRQENQP